MAAVVLLLALAQLDLLIGDLEGNAQRILGAASQAAAHRADLLLTPELSLWGYPPRDLLLRGALVERQSRVLDTLAAGLPVYEPKREDDVYRNLMENNHGPLPPDAVRRIFERVMDEMRSLQRMRREQKEIGRAHV